MLEGFHPAVADWFRGKFGTPTEPQALGWPHIQRGADTLIAAPTTRRPSSPRVVRSVRTASAGSRAAISSRRRKYDR